MQYENEVEKPERRHSKRVGRELAMQYLFQCDLTGEKFSPDTWTAFWEQAAAEHELGDNRHGRKCREYAEKLLDACVRDADKIAETIRSLARNWDPERISTVDRSILKVAIAEMYNFPDVPPVVSIDEAVAITRDYSDERACDFVNGILNAVKSTLGRPEREGVR
ncbi:Transcription antitermination protein NusB [bioreactor metagenome]|uniref:Transcription antitermination protein NusB n=1 Tax=bioreactor metagenome TaxID=1076179 RepID=A0A645FBL5_9ZZZZ